MQDRAAYRSRGDGCQRANAVAAKRLAAPQATGAHGASTHVAPVAVAAHRTRGSQLGRVLAGRVLAGRVLAGRVLAGRVLAGMLVASLLGGCALDAAATPPSPVRSSFDTSVYPVLLRDCGFPACHGNEDRFFRVYGPGRTRLSPDAPGNMPSPEELDVSYERARSMLSGVDRASDALLLRKPLEIGEGGAPHLGIDASGRDIYASPEAPGYAAILSWSETGF